MGGREWGCGVGGGGNVGRGFWLTYKALYTYRYCTTRSAASIFCADEMYIS